MHRPVSYPLKQKTFSVVFSGIFQILSAKKLGNVTLPHSSTALQRYPCCCEMTNSTWHSNVALYWRYQQTHQHGTSEERPPKILNKNKHMVTPREVKQKALKESTNHSNINSWFPLDSQDFLGQDTQWVYDLAGLSWPDTCFGWPSKNTDGSMAVAVQDQPSCTVSSEEKITRPKESSSWHIT